MPRTRVSGSVRVNAYEVVSRAVEEGVAYGYNRAHKHTAQPTEEHLREQVEAAVMNALCEVLDFG
jgi:hypothetical protein